MRINTELPKNILRLSDVLTVVEKICEYFGGEEYDTVGCTLLLVGEDGNMKRHSSFSVCKKKDIEQARKYLNSCVGMKVKDFIEKIPYHHICTFEDSPDLENEISFDINDNSPIKADFHLDDSLLIKFFYPYMKSRNERIECGETIGNNDVYEKMKEFLKKRNKNGEERQSVFQKIKRRFSTN